MKDYKAIEGLQDNIKIEVKAAYDKGYKQGFYDGMMAKINTLLQKKKEAEEIEAYQKGLDDAWEACRKMEYMLFNEPQFKECFGDIDFYTVLTKKSASEALQKIREYEEKQIEKNCDNCAHDPETDDFSKYCKGCINSNNWQSKQDVGEIKIGDEVIYHGAPHDGDIGVVIGSKDNWREVRFLSSWSSVGVSKDTLTKTGRHFPEIEKVLKAMQG